MGVICALASLFGTAYINAYIKRTNRNSILVYSLFYLMIICIIVLPISGISRAVYDLKAGNGVFGFKSYCN